MSSRKFITTFFKFYTSVTGFGPEGAIAPTAPLKYVPVSPSIILVKIYTEICNTHTYNINMYILGVQ